MMDEYHIIYRTTNHVNGRFYVGKHSTAIIEDGYLGSGRRIKAEIQKYGRENFSREILETLPCKVSLAAKEKEIVNEKLLTDPLCLNLKNGGEGGWDHLNKGGRPSHLLKEHSSIGGKNALTAEQRGKNLNAGRQKASETRRNRPGGYNGSIRGKKRTKPEKA